MKTICFFNQKGGVAKTTSCLNTGAALSFCGFKCLLIDMDPQGSLSQSAGFDDLDDDAITTYEVLLGKSINKGIQRKETEYPYDILPTDIRLSGIEFEIVSNERRNFLLKKALEKLKGNYDYILIDCPPSLNTLSLMALTASTDVIIPVQAQYLPLKGVALIRDTINLMQEHFNPELKIAGVLLTFYNERRNLDKDVLEVLQQAFGNKLFKTMISTNTKLAEAPSHGKDIIEYSPRSKGAKQYKALALEISEQ